LKPKPIRAEEIVMTTAQKNLFEGALKLPPKMKVKLAEKLLTSLDEEILALLQKRT
jgi:hypothetical protein